MKTVKVYQVGLGSFGRYGFEKFVEMHGHFDQVDVRLKGLCEPDFEKREAAEKFAGAKGIEIETFDSPDEMYDAAEEEDGEVLVYDAGPSGEHPDNIYRSMRRGFYHVAEKPPSMTREEHIKERKLAADSDVMWKVDFIERESPVVKKAVEMVEGKNIDRIEVFRQSSVGVQKMLEPVKRAGVMGGDVLDKMVHEIYVLDLLEAAGNPVELELEGTCCDYFMPYTKGSEKMLDIHGGYTEEIDEKVATGQTSADFSSGDTDVKLHSSWLGLSDEAREKVETLELDWSPFKEEFVESGDAAFRSEETRFFVLEGEKNLFGDMLNGKLFDLDSREEVELPDLLHDQLYRVLEKSVRAAAGEKDRSVSEEEIDVFMNALYDVRQEIIDSEHDFFECLEEANSRVAMLVFSSDEKEFEAVPG